MKEDSQTWLACVYINPRIIHATSTLTWKTSFFLTKWVHHRQNPKESSSRRRRRQNQRPTVSSESDGGHGADTLPKSEILPPKSVTGSAPSTPPRRLPLPTTAPPAPSAAPSLAPTSSTPTLRRLLRHPPPLPSIPISLLCFFLCFNPLLPLFSTNSLPPETRPLEFSPASATAELSFRRFLRRFRRNRRIVIIIIITITVWWNHRTLDLNALISRRLESRRVWDLIRAVNTCITRCTVRCRRYPMPAPLIFSLRRLISISLRLQIID